VVDTPAIARSSWSSLSRLDGRCSTARRVKTIAMRLKAEIGLGRRWSFSENDELHRVATAIVMAEESQRQALQGVVPFADAAKVDAYARRAQAALKALMVTKAEPERAYDDDAMALVVRS
jgi:hypothetical protein